MAPTEEIKSHGKWEAEPLMSSGQTCATDATLHTQHSGGAATYDDKCAPRLASITTFSGATLTLCSLGSFLQEEEEEEEGASLGSCS